MTPFGSKLRALRAARGLSAKEMADGLGVSPAYLSALEHGHRGRPNRRFVLDYSAEQNLKDLTTLTDANKVGSNVEIREGQLGRKLGFDWYTDDHVPTHTRNAVGAGAMTVNGAHSVGATAISVAKGAGADWNAKKGDLITIAGDAQMGYVITADTLIVQGTNTIVPISPALRVATTGGEAITSIDTHVVNLAFHRDGMACAMRSLADANIEGGLGTFMTMADPITGLVMRVEIARQNKRYVWDLDLLYGCGLVRPQYVCRLLG